MAQTLATDGFAPHHHVAAIPAAESTPARRILIVEDNELARTQLEQLLGRDPHVQLKSTDDGHEAHRTLPLQDESQRGRLRSALFRAVFVRQTPTRCVWGFVHPSRARTLEVQRASRPAALGRASDAHRIGPFASRFDVATAIQRTCMAHGSPRDSRERRRADAPEHDALFRSHVAAAPFGLQLAASFLEGCSLQGRSDASHS